MTGPEAPLKYEFKPGEPEYAIAFEEFEQTAERHDIPSGIVTRTHNALASRMLRDRIWKYSRHAQPFPYAELARLATTESLRRKGKTLLEDTEGMGAKSSRLVELTLDEKRDQIEAHEAGL